MKAYDADGAFSAALAEFQAQPAAGSIIEEAQRATAFGFSWFARPSEPGPWEVILRHSAGAENNAKGASVRALLAGLLGHPLAQDIAVLAADQAAEPEQEEASLSPAQQSAAVRQAPVRQPDPIADKLAASLVKAVTASLAAAADQSFAPLAAAADEELAAAVAALPPSPAQAAAESLAAATGGEVVMDPEDAEQMRMAEPLTAEQKAVCVGMIKVLTADQRKAFTIAFRDAFRVPREEKAIAPLITEVRHMEFCDRWSIEAGGGVAA